MLGIDLHRCYRLLVYYNTMGAGTLSIYEYTFEGTNKKGLLYFNTLERGKILCPKGFQIKNK